MSVMSHARKVFPLPSDKGGIGKKTWQEGLRPVAILLHTKLLPGWDRDCALSQRMLPMEMKSLGQAKKQKVWGLFLT
jgi:hypothetical protein